MNWIRIFITGLAMLTATPALAGRDSVKSYIFGNSLINHLSDSPGTAVPYWLGQLARADGRSFATAGQWGFLRDFADLPPKPNWSFPGVKSAGAPRAGAGFDTVMINPANFIQYQAPDAAFEGDNPDAQSPLSATLKVLDWTQEAWPGARVMIYEGWPDIGGFARTFPPSRRGLRRWHAYATGDYRNWYDSYLAALGAARPGVDVTLVPVSSILSALQTGLLADVPVEALFTDNAPHGTDTLYFLAALVTYGAFYEAPAPKGFDLPDTLHPLVRERYPQIVDDISKALGLAPEQANAAAAGRQTASTALPGIGVQSPSLGMGLNGVSDWSSQHPFLDVMKTARPWIGHSTEDWGAFTTEALRAGGYLDANGWPLAIPEGARALEGFILSDQPTGASHLNGRYLLRYEGDGVIRVTGRADNVRYNYRLREVRFDVTPGDGPVALSLLKTDPDDPLRNITIIREDQLALSDLGVNFNPLWLDRIDDMRVLRFMDWMFTNGSVQTTWDDRPTLNDASYVWRGVPVEVMVALANEVGADPWFNMPHAADDAYMRAFAGYVRDHLDPDLRAHVEYSNEVWNFIFPQAVWARDAAADLWGEEAGEDGWIQFTGLRGAQMSAIWREVFGDGANTRLVMVVATHTGWPGLEEPLLQAPLAIAGGQLSRPPAEGFDAYAVTGYFGHDLGGEDTVESVLSWIAASRAVAEAKTVEMGLTGVAREAYLDAHASDLAYDLAAASLRQGSFRELTQELLPYHADVARRHDLRLVMYEGGSHVTGHGTAVENEALTRFFTAFNYTPQMGALYDDLLAGWSEAGGTLFNAFVDVAAPSKWGSWGALRHLNDTNPRWDALMRANKTAPEWAEPRTPDAFLQGITRQASESGVTLNGTAKADILLGGAGDDTLRGHGGNDRLHGGAGRDIAVLTGARADFTSRRDGPRVILKGPDSEVTLVAIEAVEFTAEPGAERALNDLM
ncbi:hypothetical protein SAMN05444414_11922 [Roseovarius marisflavi]|uniref:Type I secretion C-terminal target domain (VC_A0849 subclass) n=1 Tax=Roseovarius marisflavi TaxID=1054996 RepID=A0A1M7BLD2_9RHOB|nr:type I secretion protein [Roseovarius marisflavi]SHL55727.1 hypothetical protein SAMN05444414_11922 [Roseovarius marisflavi]